MFFVPLCLKELKSSNVRISAGGYSGPEFVEIIPQGTKPVNAANTLDRLLILPSSGSWTYYGLRNITVPPSYPTNVLFLITSQGSGSATRRALTLNDLPRLRALNWNITIFAMTSNNIIDIVELSSISSSLIILKDINSNDPKSYRLLSNEVNKVINSICNLYPTTTTTTTTTTKSSTTASTTTSIKLTSTAIRTTTNKKNKSTKKQKKDSASSESKEDPQLDSSEESYEVQRKS